MWQWWNFVAARAPAGHSLLRLNLDETSVKLFQGDGKGAVFFSKKRPRHAGGGDGEGGAVREARAEEPVQRVNLRHKRTCLTHVGLMCDRPDAQPYLPQVLIGNEATFRADEMGALRAACPANVHLVRQKSAWNNVETMKLVLRSLSAALRAYHQDHWHPPMLRLQPVLTMDAALIHIHPSVVRSCYALGLWPIVVPARLTWLLQPLDTHAFQKYKQHFRALCQQARLETADSRLSTSQFLETFFATIRRVLQGRRWALAFDSDGYGPRQAKTSAYILQQLQLDGPPVVPDTEPALETLQLCFPRNRPVPLPSLLLRAPKQQLALPPPAQAQAPQLALPAPPVGRPLLLRRPLAEAASSSRAGPVTRGQARRRQ